MDRDSRNAPSSSRKIGVDSTAYPVDVMDSRFGRRPEDLWLSQISNQNG